MGILGGYFVVISHKDSFAQVECHMREIYVRQVSVIDYARLDGEKGLVGESDIVDVAIQGDLNSALMIFDFGLIKRQIKALLDERIDHQLLVPSAHPNIQCRADNGQREVSLRLGTRRLVYSAPEGAVAWFDVQTIDRDCLARYCEALILAALPENVSAVRVSLRREPVVGMPLTYCHGLRDHQGNCQRLVHGHLSRLQITIDGESRPDIEQAWAGLLGDRYIGSRDDCVAARGQSRAVRGETNTVQGQAGAVQGQAGAVQCEAGAEMLYFEYITAQGRFYLEIPAERCYLLSTRTTVEMMADHLLAELVRQFPQARIQVSLDEGLGKGVRVSN